MKDAIDREITTGINVNVSNASELLTAQEVIGRKSFASVRHRQALQAPGLRWRCAPFFFCFFPSLYAETPAVPRSLSTSGGPNNLSLQVCPKPVRCRTSHSGFSSWHLCRSNCSCRLAWASVTRRSVLSGAVNCLPHAVQAATHGTVPRCLTILTALFVMTLFGC